MFPRGDIGGDIIGEDLGHIGGAIFEPLNDITGEAANSIGEVIL